MEDQLFNEIRDRYILRNEHVQAGKMMSSEAITYKDKVFAFLSRKKRMIFKLGSDFNPDEFGMEINMFSPFTSKKPMKGWYEVPYTEKEQWEPLTEKAFNMISQLL